MALENPERMLDLGSYFRDVPMDSFI